MNDTFVYFPPKAAYGSRNPQTGISYYEPQLKGLPFRQVHAKEYGCGTLAQYQSETEGFLVAMAADPMIRAGLPYIACRSDEILLAAYIAPHVKRKALAVADVRCTSAGHTTEMELDYPAGLFFHHDYNSWNTPKSAVAKIALLVLRTEHGYAWKNDRWDVFVAAIPHASTAMQFFQQYLVNDQLICWSHLSFTGLSYLLQTYEYLTPPKGWNHASQAQNDFRKIVGDTWREELKQRII